MASVTTTNDEKYCRLGLMLVNGGTKIARALFEKCVKEMTPEDHVSFPWTIDEFLQANKKTILSSQTGRANERILFPGVSGTNIDHWDLYMFCFVLVDVCGVSRTIRMDVNQLKKVRNKLSHLSEAKVDDDKYKSYVDKIEVIFDRLLLEINEQALKEEIADVLKAAKEGPLSLQDTIQFMHKFYSMAGEWREILSEHSKDIKEIKEEMREIVRNLRLMNQLPHETESENVPETTIDLLVKNCVSDKEAVITKQLVDMINESACSSSTGKQLKVEYSKMKEAVQDIVEKFLAQGRVIVNAEERCVLLRIKCTSFASLLSLFDDCISGDIDKDFKQLETCIREIRGYEQVTLEAVILEEEFWKTISQTVSSLQELSRSYTTAFRSNTGSQNSDISTLSDVNLVERISPTTEDEKRIHHAVRLKIRTNQDCKDQLKQSVKDGTFDSSINRLKEEIMEHYDLTKLSIEARVLDDESQTQADADHVLCESMKEEERTFQQGCSKPLESCLVNRGSFQIKPNTRSMPIRGSYNLDEDIDSSRDKENKEYAETVLKQEQDYFSCKDVKTEIDQIREALKLDADDREIHENVTDIADLVPQIECKQYNRNEVTHMEATNICNLIERAREALDKKEEERAKILALQAIVGANNEKENFLTGHHVTVTEQQLADWYGGFSFIFNKIGENMTAARCFYTATIFDPEWRVENHMAVSEALWMSLVYLRGLPDLSLNIQKIRCFLAELDSLAKLAEREKKWSVCIAIDEDINKIYTFLRTIGLGPRETIEEPGRKAAISRSARCYLNLNMHQEVQKVCSTILQHFSENDDPEALAVWAQSLYLTGDYDLAYQKNNLALKYCQDVGDKDKLLAFKVEIEGKLALSFKPPTRYTDEGWIEGTNYNSATSTDSGFHDDTEKRKKRRHKKSKALESSGQGTHRLGAQLLERTKGRLYSLSRLSSETASEKTTKTENSAEKHLQYEKIGRQRSRNSSSMTVTDASDVLTDTSTVYTASDTDSTEGCTVYTASPKNENPTSDFISEQDDEAYKGIKSFYEQSCDFYLQTAEKSDDLRRAETEENLLKKGISLNTSFLLQFEEPRSRGWEGESIFTNFFNKSKLQELMLQNPMKYIKCVIQIEGCDEAFCTPVEEYHSISIIKISGRSKIGQAFNEDDVIVELLDDWDSKGKMHGKVIGVWNRQRHRDTKHPVFICTLDDIESHLVRPMCKTIPKIHILNREIKQKYKNEKTRRYKVEIYEYDERAGILCDPKIVDVNPADTGSVIFFVALIKWDAKHIYPTGAIIKRLPTGTSIATGLMVLNLQHEIPTLYKQKTIEQVSIIVQSSRDKLAKDLLQDRIDLTNLNTFTIDQSGSKDLDVALSIEKIDGGYRVGVHIADVATFVKKDSPLDEEARDRATTFSSCIGKSRNMIPEPLSNNICSLLENKLRLTISVFFCLESNGRLLQMKESNCEIIKSYIRSKRQLTYGQAQAMIVAKPDERQDIMTCDVKALFNIAHAIRKNRLGYAMYALDVEWEETDESEKESREARYLVDEFKILTNTKIAERLLRSYKHCIPLHCQPPPSKEKFEAFLKRNAQYMDILVRFQGKLLGQKQASVYDCLSVQTTKTVMLSKSVWEAMEKAPKSAAATLIRKDDIHPLQLVVYQQWLSIQESAGYRCSGSIAGNEDGKHLSLDIFPYTHFTSPIRRYNDLIIQRLIHAAVFQKIRPPYDKEEIDSICLHINSVSKRAEAYEKGCKSLQQAMDLKTNPKMVNCYVGEVSDKGITLCSPVFKYVAKPNREITFNQLNMGDKPEVLEDTNTHWDKVKAVWRKRLYNFQICQNYPTDRGNELKLNPHLGVVFLPLNEWAKLVQCSVEGHFEDLSRAIRSANITHHGEGLDDVSTECLDPLQIQPRTRFSMTLIRGQQLKIQMSASPHKGIVAPEPMLYEVTNNVKLCLQHTSDPVLHLYRYATLGTCDQYKSVKQYLERWLPLMLMESAAGIVRNEESCTINNVPVNFIGEGKGKFALGLAECEVRNIELSGAASDDEDENDENIIEEASSYDWLCLKTTIPSRSKSDKSNVEDIQTFDPVWVGHAEVTKVKRKKDKNSGGTLTVSFSLHEKAPNLPKLSTNQLFSVEVLKKSEVDRQTESFIKMLPSAKDSLAATIALNKCISDLDRDYKHIASLIERDLYYDLSKIDKRRRPLPLNNAKQQEAIDKALMNRFSLIQGPPGTGKTYTGIKLLTLFNRVNSIQHKEGKQKKQVLFCGPSNRSVDLVAEWMNLRMGDYRPDFVRVYDKFIEALDFPIPGRTFLSKRSNQNQKASPVLYDVTLHHLIRREGNKFAEEINAYDKLFKDNNYQPMPDKVAKYVQLVREASIDEIRKHDVILCTTAVGSNLEVFKATNIYQVVVDEAGMCTEPQCLVPIIATGAEQVVLIGDHKQLRPVIMCKEAGLLGLETSLFERYAVTNTQHMNNVKFTMLEKQYRLNPQICRFPSEQFYNNGLITRIWTNNQSSIWPKYRETSYPHIFVHVEGEEKVLTVFTEEEGIEQSKINKAEINVVIKMYSYFTKEKSNDSVQILSQYNAQVFEIKRRLNVEGFVDEHVSTVLSSQDEEWDYVIFSTVRSLPNYKIESHPTSGWCKHNLGFLADQNQINVALTRARKGLIIIGNKNLLACDQFVWRKLIEHLDRRGCLKTPAEFPPRTERTRRQIMDENKEEWLRWRRGANLNPI